MDERGAAAFAAEWAARWNARDVDGVLAHYAEDVVFSSPLAGRHTGRPVVEGRAALGAYWRAALAAVDQFRFTIDRVIWDPGGEVLVLFYLAELDGQRTRVCELMQFDPAGKVIRGEAFYGATV